jgi:hypothetical protein
MPRGKRQPSVYLSHVEAERAAWEEERRRLVGWLVEACYQVNGPSRSFVFRSEDYATEADCAAAIRAELATASGKSREGEK